MTRIRSFLLAAVAIAATSVLAVQAQVPGVNSTLNAVFNLVYDASTMKPTFSASQVFAPASLATDVCILTGSATKTIKVRRIIFGGQNIAAVVDPVEILKRSALNTLGTNGFMQKLAYDTTNSLTGSGTNTATAIAEYYTANGVGGTLIGMLADIMVPFGNLTTGAFSNYTFEFGALGSPVVLRGAAQQVTVNLNGLSFTQGLISCTFEWTEE